MENEYQEFYQKYGYKISNDRVGYDYSGEMGDLLADGYNILREMPFGAVRKLENYVKRYPDIPPFKNFLYLVYEKEGRDMDSKRILLETVSKHPEYVFGKTSLALMFINEGNPKVAKRYLGENLKIEDILPEREEYEWLEFLNYQYTAGKYEVAIGELKAAENRLEMMITLAPEHQTTRKLANELMLERSKKSSKRFAEEKERAIKVKFKPSYVLEQIDTPPELTHQELEAFYLYDEGELPEEIIKDIMALPKDSLIADLEKILEDSIRRNDSFLEKYEDDFDLNEQSFVVHALRFLTALEADKGLQAVLNIFRQGYDFIEYWFGEDWGSYFDEPLYLLGKNKLDTLKSFVLEPHQEAWTRAYVAEAVTQVALHDPKRHTEVLGWFTDVFDYVLENEKDEKVIDTIFITWTLVSATNIRASELLPYVDKLDEKKWIEYSAMGEVAEIKRQINTPIDPSDIQPMPRDIYEFYNKKYQERRAKRDFSDIEHSINSITTNYITNIWLESFKQSTLSKQAVSAEDNDHGIRLLNPDEIEHVEPYKPQTIRQKSTKVGRNDPCTCGSGKKYKKCCGKK